MGHPTFYRKRNDEKREGEFILSHPSHKNKNVARMGHPIFDLILSDSTTVGRPLGRLFLR
jgi:hypothetical protein